MPAAPSPRRSCPVPARRQAAAHPGFVSHPEACHSARRCPAAPAASPWHELRADPRTVTGPGSPRALPSSARPPTLLRASSLLLWSNFPGVLSLLVEPFLRGLAATPFFEQPRGVASDRVQRRAPAQRAGAWAAHDLIERERVGIRTHLLPCFVERHVPDARLRGRVLRQRRDDLVHG